MQSKANEERIIMQGLISEATKRNWERLSVDMNSKLKSRANKLKSLKKILPIEYIQYTETIDYIKFISDNYIEHSVSDIIYSVAIQILGNKKLLSRQNVQKIIDDFKGKHLVSLIDIKQKIPDISLNEDVLGALYQSLLVEGNKNKIGSYYTPNWIISDILEGLNFKEEGTLLDPCCGSGAFLLNVEVRDPNLLYGVEKDEIAAFIARVNLLIKYSHIDFSPNIICADFLSEDNLWSDNMKFDFIATNPPWGSKIKYTNKLVDSKESFVHFFIKSYNTLKSGGGIGFLFPESILNVKTHKFVREFIIKNQDLHEIHKYKASFTGVATNFVSLILQKNNISDSVIVKDEKHNVFDVDWDTFSLTSNKVFTLLRKDEKDIVKSVIKQSKYSLKSSQWALGIVTGDNKNKLFSDYKSGLEKIYTGKEIGKYRLKTATKFIVYDRDSFQQVAKDEIYRADEKLVYKFVSNKLVFAYDDTASLFLNSANILIPQIPGMSTKTVMAFLNSSLYQFLYEKMFGELKVLKGNLSELPFPEIDEITDDLLSKMVDEILHNGRDLSSEIDSIIYGIYGLEIKK